MFSSLAKEKIRPLLKLNDQLRFYAKEEHDIHISSIIVVGDQSHGKTSVLEALSGVDLPRGEGIQTRVPLVLTLASCDNEGEERAEISIGEAKKEKVSLKLVAEKVQEYTNQIAGSTNDVVDKPIHLTVYRQDQDDLTLVDLPGMTRVPQKGQHEKIEDTITNMYRNYMKSPDAVLLNVVTAMVDFSTSKSLQLSKEFDPNGQRTILVVTKLDQHTEPGLDKKILRAFEDLELRKNNLFCVRNRTQTENNSMLPLKDAREIEKTFFKNHLELKNVHSHCLGVGKLSESLVEIQCERIKATLPNVSKKIYARYSELTEKIDKMKMFFGDEAQCQEIFEQSLGNFSRALITEREGTASNPSPFISFFHIDRKHKFPQSLSFDAFDQEICFSITKDSLGNGSLQLEMITKTQNLSVVGEIKMTKNEGLEKKVIIKVELTTQSPRAIVSDLPAAFLGSEITVTGGGSATREYEERKMICTLIHNLDKGLTSVFDVVRPEALFSSKMTQNIQLEASVRSGATGMPFSISTIVGVRIFEALVANIPMKIHSFATAYKNIIQEAVVRLANEHFKEFPNLCRVVVEVLDQVFQQKMNELRNNITRLVVLESVVHTTNPEYLSIKEELTTILNKIKESTVLSFDGNSGLVPSKYERIKDELIATKSLSSENLNYFVVQVEVFAYWEVYRKRLSDYVQLSCRYDLITQIVDSSLVSLIKRAVSNQTNGIKLQELMKRSANEIEEFEKLKRREDGLKNAIKLLSEQGFGQLSLNYTGSKN